MISCLRNDNGFIYAYIEWYILDQFGQFQSMGNFMYINDVWVHPDYRNNKCIERIIPQLHNHNFSSNVRVVYWARDKYNGKISKYLRLKLSKKGEYYGKQRFIEFATPCS